MPSYVDAVETHTGVVVFLGDRAYKLKKPLDLGFVDNSTRALRQEACRVEVELNRRLAPDVYLGVGGLQDPDRDAPEPVVVMRRLPPERRLSALVRGEEAAESHVAEVARLLADFHRTCPITDVAREAAGPEATLGRWEDNHAGLAPYLPAIPDPAVPGLADEVVGAARDYLAGRTALLEARIEAGWARDGHGDLLADDVFCLDDGPRVLDCLEFDPRLRQGDVLADVAFLAMDLERLGRPDLGHSLLGTHRDLLGDDWPASLAHHHVAYRAQVRAKVAAIRAAQGDAASVAAVRELLEIAREHLRAGEVRLVLVGGLPGTGKSTLGSALAGPLDAEVLRSDTVRKEQAGLDPARPATAAVGEGLYRPELVEATYDELLSRARGRLEAGTSVVLDASWSDAGARERARAVARDTSATLVELRCVTSPDLARRRIAARAEAGGDPSDATVEVHEAMAARFAPWPEAQPVATDVGVEVAGRRVLDLLGRAVRPAPGPGPS